MVLSSSRSVMAVRVQCTYGSHISHGEAETWRIQTCPCSSSEFGLENS